MASTAETIGRTYWSFFVAGRMILWRMATDNVYESCGNFLREPHLSPPSRRIIYENNKFYLICSFQFN